MKNLNELITDIKIIPGYDALTSDGVVDAVSREKVLDLIETNRADLEEGLRGRLRFKLYTGLGFISPVYAEVDADGMLFEDYLDRGSGSVWVSREHVLRYCKARNLGAEFVG